MEEVLVHYLLLLPSCSVSVLSFSSSDKSISSLSLSSAAKRLLFWEVACVEVPATLLSIFGCSCYDLKQLNCFFNILLFSIILSDLVWRRFNVGKATTCLLISLSLPSMSWDITREMEIFYVHEIFIFFIMCTRLWS